MFVRTPRLTLRPAWAEDAPAVATAIGHESVVRNLARPPWPYPIEAAETFVGSFGDPTSPKFLIFDHAETPMRLIGAASIESVRDNEYELGYWITPDAWGRGYATEAARGVLDAARALGIRRVTAGHFLDNPASGRVLRKLGFRPTGRTVSLYSRGRGAEATTLRFELDLSGGKDCGDPCGPDPDARMAA